MNTHVRQHSVLEGLVQYGYSGIDERSKVRHLLDGIKTSEFDACKTQIQSSSTLRNDFQACVTLYKDFIKQSDKKGTTTLTIAKLAHIPANKRPRDGEVEDRYYTKAEYDALKPEQKKSLALKRLKRGHKPGSKSSTATGGKSDINKLTKTIAALSKKVDALPGAEDADAEEENETKSQSNRTNAALTRQKKDKV